MSVTSEIEWVGQNWMIFPRALVFHGKKATVMKLSFNIQKIGAFGYQKQGDSKIRVMIDGTVFDLSYTSDDERERDYDRECDYRSLKDVEEDILYPEDT